MWFDNEGCETITSKEQKECESKCNDFFISVQDYSKSTRAEMRKSGLLGPNDDFRLFREKHISYLKKNLGYLSSGFACLDSSRPWMIYWICHALYLLEGEPVEQYGDIISTLQSMQNETGGYAGGPKQLSHL
jgi:protein farnesyltransferase subunit beta